MTPLPIDPARCDALAHGIETLVALSGCTPFEANTVLLSITLNRSWNLSDDEQLSLIATVSGALTLATKPRLDA